MKKIILTALVAFGCLNHDLPASVTFTGTALISSSGAGNPLGLTAGQVGIWLNRDDSATPWSTLFGPSAISSGLSLTSESTYNASLFSVMGSTTATATALSGNVAGLSLSPLTGITSGDQYAVLVFNTSTTSTVAGDTYKIWRASDWLIPADGSNITYSSTTSASAYSQVKTADLLLGSGSVIPEPSSASLLAIGVAGLVALRIRRRS
jgi:hypothetical protein